MRQNATTGQRLPRIAPALVGATLAWGQGPWGARLRLSHAAAQHDVLAGRRVTSSYVLVNAALTYRQKVGAANLRWFARIDNLGDQLAYLASSILTQTVPGKAPLTGRSIKVGLQAGLQRKVASPLRSMAIARVLPPLLREPQ